MMDFLAQNAPIEHAISVIHSSGCCRVGLTALIRYGIHQLSTTDYCCAKRLVQVGLCDGILCF